MKQRIKCLTCKLAGRNGFKKRLRKPVLALSKINWGAGLTYAGTGEVKIGTGEGQVGFKHFGG
jgi:hypothetical protein